MKYIKKYYKYFIYFIIFLVFLILFGSNNTDNIWNYGMAHGIRCGLIPYSDLNIITTPLYHYIMSIPLFIYDSYITYLITQSILCTILMYFIDKIIPDNKYIFMFFMCFPVFYFLFPNYNFLVFLFLVIIIYLEKNNSNDFLIGIILGLLILSKHTVGGVIFICSLLSTRSLIKSRNRFIGCFIVGILFFIYLIIFNNFFDFISLGIFGLFDFSSSNKYFSFVCTGIFIIILSYSLYSFYKYKRDYLNYYLIGSLSLVIPIIDLFHIMYLVCFFILVLLIRYCVNKRVNIIFIFMIICLFCINIFINSYIYKDISFNRINHFDLYLVNNDRYKYISDISSRYNSYSNSYMFSFSSMFFDVTSDRELTYFDMPLYGNFGYKGLDKMISKIDNMRDVYFFISDNDNRQFAKEIYNHIKDNYEYIDSIYDFEIYYIK